MERFALDSVGCQVLISVLISVCIRFGRVSSLDFRSKDVDSGGVACFFSSFIPGIPGFTSKSQAVLDQSQAN